MFDIGFPELLVILIVSLVVVGPDKLPQIIKFTTKTTRSIKSFLNKSKTELEKSIGMNEIMQDIHNEKIMKSIKKNKDSKHFQEKK